MKCAYPHMYFLMIRPLRTPHCTSAIVPIVRALLCVIVTPSLNKDLFGVKTASTDLIHIGDPIVPSAPSAPEHSWTAWGSLI